MYRDNAIQTREGLYPTGRKCCSSCGHWRPALDYTLYRWGDNAGLLRSSCLTCEREKGRVRNARRNGRDKPYSPLTKRTHCRRGHEYTEENTRMVDDSRGKSYRVCKTCDRAYQGSPEVLEYKRIYKEGKRREAGIPPRNFKNLRKLPEERVPSEPFQQWIYKRMQIHQCTAADLEKRFGMKKNEIYQFLGKAPKTVPLEIVDRLLTHEDDTMLWELYPGLYEEE